MNFSHICSSHIMSRQNKILGHNLWKKLLWDFFFFWKFISTKKTLVYNKWCMELLIYNQGHLSNREDNHHWSCNCPWTERDLPRRCTESQSHLLARAIYFRQPRSHSGSLHLYSRPHMLQKAKETWQLVIRGSVTSLKLVLEKKKQI